MTFKILRPGTHTTIQDDGRNGFYHLGITVSGAIDKKNFKLANIILNNNINEPSLEFALQGPLLEFDGLKSSICITGEVNFDIIRNNKEIEEGYCYKIYNLNKGDKIDIKSTINSLYGYLAIKDGFDFFNIWKSCSINTKAKIGPNEGMKFDTNQIIPTKNDSAEIKIRQLRYKNERSTEIKVIKGTNFDYFSKEAQSNFFNKKFKITNMVDRMGIRLEGNKLENIVSSNIKSEGLIKGVIQVPGDGNPIIMLADHGTIGGYPKIATVITADLDNLSQLKPNTEITFKEVSLEEAENLFMSYTKEINKYSKILNEYN